MPLLIDLSITFMKKVPFRIAHWDYTAFLVALPGRYWVKPEKIIESLR